jgi:hypothetical protein
MSTENLRQLQVAYNQGIVKTFFAPSGITLERLLACLGKVGRFRSVRFKREVTREEAERAAQAGDATMLEA